jgi:ABC-type Fe3+/spermidine/putrescine transport system ATPase subunit
LSDPLLTLTSISKRYAGGVQALDDINLVVTTGAIVSLLGPSGCGKTTLLRVIAGLEPFDRGEIRFEGQDLAHLPVHRRGFGLMFQEFALFPHRTVAENIEFGLRMARQPAPQRARRVAEMLELVNLPGYGPRTIFELSGGERQRVALARSLAPQPRLLMLDEPLGSLDRTLRENLLEELRTILKAVGVTALYVTHDQDEALALSDQIVIMRRGRIVQSGPPEAIYRQPASPFVARFLGFTNLLAATPQPHGVMTQIGEFPLTTPPETGPWTLLLRPEGARLGPSRNLSAVTPGFQPHTGDNHPIRLVGTLAGATYHGSHLRLQIRIQESDLVFQLPTLQRNVSGTTLTTLDLPPLGERIELHLFPESAVLLPYPSEAD